MNNDTLLPFELPAVHRKKLTVDFDGGNQSSDAGLLLLREWSVRTARLMVGIPDYQTYVEHRRTTHPDQPVMTYEEFFVERQNARYAVGKGRFRGCC